MFVDLNVACRRCLEIENEERRYLKTGVGNVQMLEVKVGTDEQVIEPIRIRGMGELAT